MCRLDCIQTSSHHLSSCIFLHVLGEVWQLFQDTYEFEEEQHEAVFVITDNKLVRDQNVGEKKILGGRKAEDQVRAYLLNLHRAYLLSLQRERYQYEIKIFTTHMPSMQLLYSIQGIQTLVIVASDKQALDKLSYNGCIVREFGEQDWIHLAQTLLYSERGISHKKAAELEDFKTYIRKTKGQFWEILFSSAWPLFVFRRPKQGKKSIQDLT